MERYRSSGYSTHGHFRAELFVISFALFLVAFVVFPKVKYAYSEIKMNGAIESVNSYTESINNYYVSQLLFDSNFKLDGTYTVSNGNLIIDDQVYNIRMVGNVPTDGYLDYENNILKDGCVMVSGYEVVIKSGEIVSTSKGSCSKEIALGM